LKAIGIEQKIDGPVTHLVIFLSKVISGSTGVRSKGKITTNPDYSYSIEADNF